jgi:hypothetical protein
MQIESAGCKVEVVEKAELDIVVEVGEGGQLNAVRVELGLAGKGKLSTSGISRASGLSEIEETGCRNASKMKALKS